uniref:Uncharacterized protein n=1 Tax=Rhizophora mucronata TaxID=61149 RepID=A0A2P2QJR1_RHIMU
MLRHFHLNAHFTEI